MVPSDNSALKRATRSKMARVPSATRVVAYLPSLKTILQRLRATSATPSSLNSTLLVSTSYSATPVTVWTTSSFEHHLRDHTAHSSAISSILTSPISSITTSLSLEPSFPLPGAVAPAQTTPTTESLNTDATSAEVHPDPSTEDPTVSFIKDKPHGTVECIVQEIPDFLVPELLLLFPGHQTEKLNIITLSQRTQHDMTGWSAEVEEEREQLLEHFVDGAKEICSRLSGAGFWADFIDPSSGRAYYSPYSTSTLFETDDRFRYFGLDIIDLGCCKCIQHPVWGAFTFVGTIFTSAPTHSTVVQGIMEI